MTLGSVNDSAESVVTPTLNGIETVNAAITGDVGGINFQDATGLTTVNLTRLTNENGEAWFTDLDSTVTNLSVNNATRAGEVHFHYQEEVLTATDDTLALGINSVRVEDLHLATDDDGGADQGFFFEDINVATSGNNDVDSFRIEANGREDILNGLAAGTTRQSLDIVANGSRTLGSLEINELKANGVDTMSIVANARVDIAEDKLVALDDSNDGISTNDLETLTITGAANVMIDGLDTLKQDDETPVTLTVNAGAMTGNLKLGVATASDGNSSGVYAYRADKDLSVTSGSGNDEIRTYGVLAGDISTGEGNDIVAIRDASNDNNSDVEGVSTIDAGNGNNTVSAQDLLVTATDNNQVANTGYDDVTAARIITGTGTDTVTVRDLTSNKDWDNKSLTDTNADDLYTFIGASIVTGAGDDTVTLRTVAEGASVNTGADNDTLNVSINPLTPNSTSANPSTHSVLAADTDADKQTVNNGTNGGTREVTSAEAVDRLGAIVDLGAGTADVANFAETSSFGANVVTIVGRDAELRGAETVNVTALDRITVTTNTTMVDQDGVTTGVQTDINANVLGTQTLNLTIANKINAATAALTGLTGNDTNILNTNAVITADVMRFDSSLAAINLVSQEQTLLQTAATEVYEPGTRTNYELNNMRTGVALSLKAYEATGVTAGALADDTQLAINTTTGVATANAAAADVKLTLNYDNARGLDDAAVLNVAASPVLPNSTQSFDLDLNIGATLTDTLDTDGDGNSATVANAVSATDDDTMRIENFSVKFADDNSHSIDANGFGDVVFRGVNDRPAAVAGDVSSTATTSFNVWSAASTGKTIAIDAVNADTIRVMNADGTAVTAANVTLRVDAGNNYNVTTGAGTDVFDFRADDVRSDDIATSLDRADHLNAGTGRDTLIVNGSDNLGVNNNIEGGVASTIIDDDVFATLRGIEKILVDADYTAGAESLDITLDEEAKITGVDAVAVVGTQAQTLNLEVGNNFVVQTVAVDNTNGQLTSAASALVIDASLNTGATVLNIESKDDDTDVQLINMDVRVDSDGGADVNFVNTGDVAAQVELRVYTADEADTHTISSSNAGNADGLVDIDVTTGNFDKLIVLEGEGADNGGVEGAMTIALDAAWTGTAFEVDASAVQNTDNDLTTGGATITAAYGDTATLTIKGTQNSDVITGGRGADAIDGNDGNDVITGDEVTNQNELEVVTFAATYDAGDVITVTHNTQTLTATVQAGGATGAEVAAAFSNFDNTGADGIASVVVAGTQFGSAVSTFDNATRQLRLSGATAGTDYAVSTSITNVAQVQHIIPVDLEVTESLQLSIGGVTYTQAFNTAVAQTLTDFVTTHAAAILAATGGVLTATATELDLVNATVAYGQVLGGDLGSVTLTLDAVTTQTAPGVVTETLARTVLGAADTINGGAGADTIDAGTGADVVTGGTGNDSINLGTDTVEDIVKLASGDGVDTITNFVAGTDTVQFTDFADRDLIPTSLLQQTAAALFNAAISGNNTELLVVTGSAVDVDDTSVATQVADLVTILGDAFNVTSLADGRVIFSVQDTTGASYVGYYTDVGNDDVIAAADIELVGKFTGSLVGTADFWLPTV